MDERFVYVRHGCYAKAGLSSAQRDRAPLSAEGEEQARDAGVFLRRWLGERGLRLGRVVATPKTRTQETARLATEELGIAPSSWHLETGGTSFAALMEKVERWLAPVGEGGVLLFAGSGANLGHLCNALGPDPGELARKHAAVLVYRRTEQGWRLEEAYPRVG